MPVTLQTILQWALLSGGDDVTVSKTCRSAINKRGYPWSSLHPVRVTILPGCSPGSWENRILSIQMLSLPGTSLPCSSNWHLVGLYSRGLQGSSLSASGGFHRDTLLSRASPFPTPCQHLALLPFPSPSASCVVESKDPNSSIYVY